MNFSICASIHDAHFIALGCAHGDIPTESLTLQLTFHPTFSQTTSIALQTIAGLPEAHQVMIGQHHNHLAN